MGDAPGRCFEPIEQGVPAGSALLVTGLAEEIVNRLMATVAVMADQGMDGRVRHSSDHGTNNAGPKARTTNSRFSGTKR